ncbi:MAG: hypothetical protein K2O66_00625, partial [Bacteroidales bacterium]|nr:hypothetical protein [Bacteroidales bacterium]
MAEEAKSVRLSKAAKEVNVSVGTIVEFLGKKGHEVDSNPNTKLSGEQYMLVLKEFQSDKVISEKAQGVQLESIPKKAPAELQEKPKAAVEEVSESVEPNELIIKTSEIAGEIPVKKTSRKAKEEKPVSEEKDQKEEKAATPSKKAKETAETSEKKKKKEVEEAPAEPEKPEDPVAEEAVKPEEKPEARPEEPEAVASEPVQEKEAEQVEEETRPIEKPQDKEADAEAAEPLKSYVAGPKILSTMNAQELDLARKGKAVKPEKIEHVKVVRAEPVAEPMPEPAVEEAPKEDNFIKTEYI